MESLVVRILMMILSLISFMLMIFGIPGNFIIMGIGILYYFIAPGMVTTGQLVFLILLAVSGEVVENLVGLLGAKKYGASRVGMIGAFLGSFLGGILGTMIFPVIGTFLGVFMGSFVLTFLFEYRLEGKDTHEASRAGKGALLGKVLAVSYKYSAGVVLLVLIGIILF